MRSLLTRLVCSVQRSDLLERTRWGHMLCSHLTGVLCDAKICSDVIGVDVVLVALFIEV